MRITLDIDNKIIKIEDKVNLNELFDMINKILPNDLWKEFTLEPCVINNWTSPIIIREPYIPVNPYPSFPQTPIQPQPYPIYPNQPYPSFPWITCQTVASNGISGTQMKLKSGSYNIES